MSDELADLKRQQSEIRSRINAIEAAERNKTLTAIVGRCYLYKNSCGGNRWDKFAIVTSCDTHGFYIFTFEMTDFCRFEIEPHERRHGDMSDWREITRSTFNDAWVKFSGEMTANFSRSMRTPEPST